MVGKAQIITTRYGWESPNNPNTKPSHYSLTYLQSNAALHQTKTSTSVIADANSSWIVQVVVISQRSMF